MKVRIIPKVDGYGLQWKIQVKGFLWWYTPTCIYYSWSYSSVERALEGVRERYGSSCILIPWTP